MTSKLMMENRGQQFFSVKSLIVNILVFQAIWFLLQLFCSANIVGKLPQTIK